MEIFDKVFVKDVLRRNPGMLVWAISFPIYQIVDALAPVSGLKKFFNCIGWGSIDESGGWGRTGGRAQLRNGMWLKTRDMERGMYLNITRELEVNSNRIDDFGDWKWTNKTGSKFTTLHLEGQVFGGEPNSLTNLVVGATNCLWLAVREYIAVVMRRALLALYHVL